MQGAFDLIQDLQGQFVALAVIVIDNLGFLGWGHDFSWNSDNTAI